MPQPRILTGTIPEDAPFTIYALIQRDDDRTDLDPSDVTDLDIAIYDLQGDDPDTAMWSLTGIAPAGVLTTRQPGVGAAPSGYNFKYQFGKPSITLDDIGTALNTVGGRSYRIVVTFNSGTVDIGGSYQVWVLSCASSHAS